MEKEQQDTAHVESAQIDQKKSPEILSWTAEFAFRDEDWHRQETKKLLRKIDSHLLPWIVLMYLTNFLDRKYAKTISNNVPMVIDNK